MTKKGIAPENLRGSARAVVVDYKDTKISLSLLQYQFFVTLSSGGKHSSHRLMQLLHTSDQRKEVQYLRRKGVEVLDEWIAKTSTTPRHKLYWISLDGQSEQPLL